MPSADREERKKNDRKKGRKMNCLQVGLFLTLLNSSCNFSFKGSSTLCTLVIELFYAVFMVR